MGSSALSYHKKEGIKATARQQQIQYNSGKMMKVWSSPYAVHDKDTNTTQGSHLTVLLRGMYLWEVHKFIVKRREYSLACRISPLPPKLQQIDKLLSLRKNLK